MSQYTFIAYSSKFHGEICFEIEHKMQWTVYQAYPEHDIDRHKEQNIV